MLADVFDEAVVVGIVPVRIQILLSPWQVFDYTVSALEDVAHRAALQARVVPYDETEVVRAVEVVLFPLVHLHLGYPAHVHFRYVTEVVTDAL